MKKYSMYTEESLITKVTEIYKKQGEGVTTALDCFIELRRRTLPLLREVFTKQELSAIIDAYNGTIMDRNYFGLQFFIAQIEDADTYESLCAKHEINLQELIEKATKLHPSELFFLLEEVNWFWNNNQGNDLDVFLQTYTKH